MASQPLLWLATAQADPRNLRKQRQDMETDWLKYAVQKVDSDGVTPTKDHNLFSEGKTSQFQPRAPPHHVRLEKERQQFFIQ